MKILVFSDSHSDTRKMREVLNMHKATCQVVMFLGDGLKDIRYLKNQYPNIAFFEVKGNCDFFEDGETEKLINIEKFKILICHGDKYGVKSGYATLAKRGESQGADAVFFGHTHQPFDGVMEINGKNIHLFNPGSIGKQGNFGVVNTSGKVLVTSHGKIL